MSRAHVNPGVEFAHAGWATPSLDRSVRFWTEVMGFSVVSTAERRGDWIGSFTGVPGASLRIAHLAGHGQRLELLEFVTGGSDGPGLPPQQSCTAHICVRTPDVQALCERIVESGGQLQGRITTITEGPAAGTRGLYLRDPCGFLIELLESA